MRGFIAISVPPKFRAALGRSAEDFQRHRRELRWVDRDNLHLTLAFLGEVPAQHADSIRSGMSVAAQSHGAFNLGFGGGGTFPRGGEPRVGWVGVTGDLEAVRTLQADVARAMRDVGLRVDQRPFSPHITLARINRHATPSARIAIARQFGQLNLDGAGQFTVSAIALMESDLTADGAVYREAFEVELGGAQATAAPERRRFGIFRRAADAPTRRRRGWPR